MAGAAITTASVKVGLDASKFKAGVDGLKEHISGITSTATKMIGLLGIGYLGLQGTIEGVKASFGKVMAFEKTQAAIEAVAGGAEKAKNLVATLSEITGRNEEQGTALANMARKFINIGMSADEANALVKSFYKAAKAGPDEVTETYAKLENLAIQIEERGVAPIKAWINISKAGIPIFDVMASVLTKNLGRVVTSQEAVKMLEGGAIDASTALQTLSQVGSDPRTQKAVTAMGYTMAGAMKKAKGEISLYFYEIGKFLNYITGGTKTYVTLFKGITSVVHWMREQIAALPDFLQTRMNFIPAFINGLKFLWDSFITGSKLVLSTSAEGWMMIGKFIVDTYNSGIEGLNKLSQSGSSISAMIKAMFDGFGEYLSSFGESVKAIGYIFTAIVESFGLDLTKVTNLWEGIYETFMMFKEAAQIGFLGIGQLGVEAMNAVISVVEKLINKTKQWYDNFKLGLTALGETYGILNEGATFKKFEEQVANGKETKLGRFDAGSFATAREDMLSEFKKDREARLKEYQEKATKRKEKAAEEEQKFQRDSLARGGMGNQPTAPSLLTRGGADEYKLLVERQQGSLVDLAKQQIDETAKTNQILENVRDGMVDNATAIRQLQPAAPIIGLIPQG